MINKTIQIYNYSELSDRAKEKVLNHFKENNDYYFLEDSLKEYLKELLDENKLILQGDFKMFYQLSSPQGDYFGFEGEFILGSSIFNDKKIYVNFGLASRTSSLLGIMDEDYESLDDDKLTEYIEDLYSEICDKCKKYGYEYILYEDSEENIKSNIEANDYYFTENGDIESP